MGVGSGLGCNFKKRTERVTEPLQSTVSRHSKLTFFSGWLPRQEGGRDGKKSQLEWLTILEAKGLQAPAPSL